MPVSQILTIASLIAGILSAVLAAINLMTQTPSDIARKNLLTYIPDRMLPPDWVLTHAGLLAWLFAFLAFGLWAWRRHRRYELRFAEKPEARLPDTQVDPSDSQLDQVQHELKRDTWFLHAAYYAAFGEWPNLSRPIFYPPPGQVPEGEHDTLRAALEEMAQKASDEDLCIWGKTPVRSSGFPVQGSLFSKVPASHWGEWRVKYMDLITDNPEQVHTSKGLSTHNGAWGALMVNRFQVEAIWPKGSKPRPPLKILVGIGPGYEDDMGTLHDVNAVLLNENVPMLNGVVLYRTLLANDPEQNKRIPITEQAISLAKGQKHIVRIARYDENHAILEENRKIMLWAPSSFFNASTLLPVARYGVLLEAESAIDGVFCKEVCRLWVDAMGNRLRLEHLRNIASMGDPL